MNSAKEFRKTIEWERLETSLRKLVIPREHFFAEKGTIKDKNGKDQTKTDKVKKRWQLIHRRTVQKSS